ncbi:hypothetical protein MRX96_011681 [Rhipicephalus microplus]
MAVDNLLRVSSFNYAPYHVITEEGFNVPVKGVCGEILAAITRSLRTKLHHNLPFGFLLGIAEAGWKLDWSARDAAA